MFVTTPKLVRDIQEGRYEVARAIRHPNGVLLVMLEHRSAESVEGPRSLWLTLDPPEDMAFAGKPSIGS